MRGSQPVTPAFLQEKDEPSLFNRLCFLDSTERVSYAEKGLICKHVQAHNLHEQRIDPATNRPCSFTRWLRLASPWGYSQCFAAMRDVDELHDVSSEDLAAMPAGNLSVMKQLSTAVRSNPEVLRMAKTGRSEELVEHVRLHHADQHIEHRRQIKFTVDESAAETIEKALATAENQGARSRAESLEMIAVVAMQQWALEAEVESAMTT